MNKLDKDYLALCQDILDNGTKKQTRTGTDSISIFGRQIRHKMSDGFPLLTTKKMAWKQIVTELLWFLRGDTNIKFLLDNDCHIWDGDAYKRFLNETIKIEPLEVKQRAVEQLLNSKESKEEFINKIKTDDEFAKKWGELGPIYGKQWRRWELPNYSIEHVEYGFDNNLHVDQIQNLINDLKTNPDSRRLIVSAWNVGELDQMVLPPCHYGFQVYTRELSWEERSQLLDTTNGPWDSIAAIGTEMDRQNLPKRAISLMWNQRSVDVPLGLPFNIASYGLLLHILAEATNMIPDELIGNLGDCHIYENQIEQAKEQIGRELTYEERIKLFEEKTNRSMTYVLCVRETLDSSKIPTRTREPYPLPTLNINTEFWPTESGESGVGPLVDNMDWLIRGMEITDFQVENYQSHPSIKIPLSN